MKNGDYILVVAPDWYKGKRYRGRYCYEHHLVWEQNTGTPVPDGYIVHHKDRNKFNNSFDNLELLKNSEHAKLHSTRGKTMAKLRCPYCKKVFVREKRGLGFRNISFCSLQCAGKFYNSKNPDIEEAKKQNIICFFLG